MKERPAVVTLTCLSVLLACSPSDRSGSKAWHEAPPPLTIAVSCPAEAATVWATVEAVPAPDIPFSALVQPDPNHVSPVTAPASGIVVRMEAERHARRGNTLVVVGQGSETAGRTMAVVGKQDGAWKPRRRQGQVVWQDDTLGLLEEDGYWLAVGTVSDIESGVIHAGDPASVQFGTDRHAARPGRVEWVRRPGASSAYSTDVAVEFRGSKRTPLDQSGAVTVVVSPADPQDTLTAVPATAVVQLPPGQAVFVPVGNGVFDVRWVSTGPSVDDMIVVREAMRPGMTVVARGLAGLVEAARDSLARRSVKP